MKKTNGIYLLKFVFLYLFLSFEPAIAELKLKIKGKTYVVYEHLGSGSYGTVFLAKAVEEKAEEVVLKFYSWDLPSEIPQSSLSKRELFNIESRPGIGGIKIENPEGLFVEPITSDLVKLSEDQTKQLIEGLPEEVAKELSHVDGVVVFPYRGLSLPEYIMRERMIVQGGLVDLPLEKYIPKVEKTFQIFEGMLQLLQLESHSRIYHADIKPQNLLFYRGTAKLYAIDFATSFLIDEVSGESKILRSETYAAPELSANYRVVDGKTGGVTSRENLSVMSNVFSYGRTLREVLCVNCSDEEILYELDKLLIRFAKEQPEDGQNLAKLELMRLFLEAALIKDPVERLKAFRDGPISDYLPSVIKVPSKLSNVEFRFPKKLTATLNRINGRVLAVIFGAEERLKLKQPCDVVLKKVNDGSTTVTSTVEIFK